MRTRVIVVAHRAGMVAEGIAAGLARFPGIVPGGVATSSAQCEEYGRHADAVAVDQYLPGVEQLARSLRRRGVRVVTLGEPDEEADGIRVSMHAPLSALATALAPGRQQGDSATPSRLTPREHEVISLAAEGLAGKQIARQLGISPKTVEQHKTKVFAKLGVRNQTAAVRELFREGPRPAPKTIDLRDFPGYRVTARADTI